MCSRGGHGKNKCPKLTLYGSMPLYNGDMEIRQKLGNNRMDIEHFKTPTRDELNIHKRYFIQANVVKNKSSNKMCLECTFLLNGGEEDLRYTRTLFRTQDVAGYAQKTISHTVVSLLHTY